MAVVDSLVVSVVVVVVVVGDLGAVDDVVVHTVVLFLLLPLKGGRAVQLRKNASQGEVAPPA